MEGRQRMGKLANQKWKGVEGLRRVILHIERRLNRLESKNPIRNSRG